MAIQKLGKYVELMEESPAYWAAMILHPGLKRRWIDRCLGKAHAARAFAAFERLYEEEYEHIVIPMPEPPPPPSRRGTGYLLPADDDFYDLPDDPNNKDEVAEYLQEQVFYVEDIELWWLQRKERLPRLSKMARDLYSIPTMSSGCERVFSLAKLVIGSQRQRMTEETINKLMCVKLWQGKPGL
jgi:hypothetical protein